MGLNNGGGLRDSNRLTGKGVIVQGFPFLRFILNSTFQYVLRRPTTDLIMHKK